MHLMFQPELYPPYLLVLVHWESMHQVSAGHVCDADVSFSCDRCCGTGRVGQHTGAIFGGRVPTWPLILNAKS